MTTSKITIASVFKTSDMQTHGTRKEAEIHQLGLEIRSQLLELGFKDEGNLKQISLALAKNSDKLSKTLSAARRKIAACR